LIVVPRGSSGEVFFESYEAKLGFLQASRGMDVVWKITIRKCFTIVSKTYLL